MKTKYRRAKEVLENFADEIKYDIACGRVSLMQGLREINQKKIDLEQHWGIKL